MLNTEYFPKSLDLMIMIASALELNCEAWPSVN